jgi:mono/diheme cytochrome c family protein
MSSCSVRGVVTLVMMMALGALGARAAAQGFYAGRYEQQTGADLYRSICQACHMSDARGAVGAGAYPALASNKRLKAALYPIAVVINGRKAMPAFGDELSDAQIASVVNYIRTNFGNHYSDAVTAAIVKTARH